VKKIFFLNTNKQWGGGEKWHLNAALFLQKHGYTSHLICYPNSDLAKEAKKKSLLVSEVKIGKLSFLNPIIILKLRRILSEADTMIMNLPQDFKIGTIVANSLNYKRIIYRRGMPHPIKNTFINKNLFPKLTHIIANSEEIRRNLSLKSPWFPDHKVSIIYNGISTKDLNKDTKIFDTNPVRIGCIARLTKQKALHEAIEIAKILKEQNFNFTLSIAGKGEKYEELKSLIFHYNLQKQVSLIGHVENVSEHMKKLDYFLFPSHFEGSPNTLIEAMGAQLICFAYSTSSVPEIIEDGITGYLAPKSDIQMLAQKIINHNCPQISKAAQDKVFQKFDYEKNMQKLLEIIS
jgi:glycosyltransferase involved in cell wall biosynthesis